MMKRGVDTMFRNPSIAILDTGVAPVTDLHGRIICSVDFINGSRHAYDDNAHGTHVRPS